MDNIFIYIKTSDMYINTFKLVEENNNWIIPKDIIEYMIIKSGKYRFPYLEIFEIRHKRKFLFITYYKKICFCKNSFCNG